MDNLFFNGIEAYLDCISLNISDIKNEGLNSLEWLKRNTHKIKKDCKPIFDFFFLKNNLGVNEIPQYYVSPYWGEATGNYKMRYMVIKDHDVYSLVCFRIIGIMYHEMYACISCKILSDNGRKTTHKKIIDTLSKIDCVKKIEIFSNENDGFDNVNFFCTKENLFFKNKRRRKQYKRSMKLLESGVNFKVLKIYNNDFKQKCDKLFDDFETVRFKFNRRVTYKMINSVLLDNSNTVFTWWLNEKLIAIQVVCNDFVNIASIHCGKDITTFPLDFITKEYTGGNYTLAKELKSYLGILQEEQVKEIVFNELNYDALYIDGTHGDKGKYLEHKRKHYDKCIFYKMIEIEKYGIDEN